MRGQRTHYTYVTLRAAAKEALDHAEADQQGSFFDSMLSILASVFTLEAFLNHLGADRHTDWDKAGERQPPKDKLKSIAKEVGFNLDHTSSEYQTIMRSIEFRHFWVHGKTTTAQEEWIQSRRGRPSKALESTWERMCEPQTARETLHSVEQVIKALWVAAGLPRGPFNVSVTASGHES